LGKVTCLKCSRVFDSEIEYRIHYSHNHPGAIALARMDLPRVNPVTFEPKDQIEEHESGPEYALATSKEGLGELCPVLKDHFGNIIDGFHRKGENAAWREETLDWIDTPEKLEAARLAVNFARRRMAPEEIKERVTYLVGKAKMSTEQIAKLTGIAERTVRKYMPQAYRTMLRFPRVFLLQRGTLFLKCVRLLMLLRRWLRRRRRLRSLLLCLEKLRRMRLFLMVLRFVPAVAPVWIWLSTKKLSNR
jgi:hypothetical protein